MNQRSKRAARVSKRYCLLLLSISVLPLRAQVTAAISGTVEDSSGTRCTRFVVRHIDGIGVEQAVLGFHACKPRVDACVFRRVSDNGRVAGIAQPDADGYVANHHPGRGRGSADWIHRPARAPTVICPGNDNAPSRRGRGRFFVYWGGLGLERPEKMGSDPLKHPKTKGSDPFFSERS